MPLGSHVKINTATAMALPFEFGCQIPSLIRPDRLLNPATRTIFQYHPNPTPHIIHLLHIVTTPTNCNRTCASGVARSKTLKLTRSIALENMSAASQPVKRHSSTSEREWLRQLVTSHGDDYERMSRDKKLNVWQKTPGEIRRMIKKAGGREKLLR